jgi:hypothetical protein
LQVDENLEQKKHDWKALLRLQTLRKQDMYFSVGSFGGKRADQQLIQSQKELSENQ